MNITRENGLRNTMISQGYAFADVIEILPIKKSVTPSKSIAHIQSSGLLKALSPFPGRPVQLNTTRASLGSIQPHCN